MKKKRSIFYKFICFAMVFCMSFVFVGCIGKDDEDIEDLEDLESEFDGGSDTPVDDPDSLVFDMYGTKVLYRPLNYDYNEGAGGTDSNPNDYYGKYAWNVLKGLYDTYGILDAFVAKPYLGFAEPNEDNTLKILDETANTNFESNQYYFYDSIRYKVDTFGTVTHIKDFKNYDGTPKTLEDAGQEEYIIVGADYGDKWNWSFNYDLTELPAGLLLDEDFNNIVKTEYVLNLNGKLINSAHETLGNFQDLIGDVIYVDKEYSSTYQKIYLGTTTAEEDIENDQEYSEYVKALEYAIYCYALDLEPDAMYITYGDGIQNPEYSIQVGNYAPDEDKTSVDVALESIKDLFQQTGSYVGLTQRQMTKIKAWIKTNVIGSKAMDDTFVTYDSVTQVVAEDGKISYEFGQGTTTTLGRNYSQAVDNIVDMVCEKVQIGSADEDGNGAVDDSFLASEIMEYAGNNFMISGDSNFTNDPNASKYHIRPQEYQSVVLMLKEESMLEGLYIALKYDADDDGTEDGVWDESKYLDIIVELNYFSHEEKKMYTIGSELTRVYDGPFDIGHENAPAMYEDFGNVYFYDFYNDCKDKGIESHLDEEGRLKVGQFKTDIGGGALMTDVGKLGHYMGFPLVSNNPIILKGTHPARRFYSLLEPSEEETATLNGKTYVSGRLNPNKFMESDGCDYIEITYKVLKDHKTDTSKNYKFYTGISFIY